MITSTDMTPDFQPRRRIGDELYPIGRPWVFAMHAAMLAGDLLLGAYPAGVAGVDVDVWDTGRDERIWPPRDSTRCPFGWLVCPYDGVELVAAAGTLGPWMGCPTCKRGWAIQPDERGCPFPAVTRARGRDDDPGARVCQPHGRWLAALGIDVRPDQVVPL